MNIQSVGERVTFIAALLLVVLALWGIGLQPAAAQENSQSEERLESSVDYPIEDIEVDFDIPSEAEFGEELSVEASVPVPERLCSLCSPLTAQFELTLLVDGESKDTYSVEVETGEIAELSLSHTFNQVGCAGVEIEYQADVDLPNLPTTPSISGTQGPINLCVEAPEIDPEVEWNLPDEVVAGEQASFEAAVSVPELPGPQTRTGSISLSLLVDGEASSTATVEATGGQTAELEFTHTFTQTDCVDTQFEGELELEDLPPVSVTVPPQPIELCVDFPKSITEFGFDSTGEIPEELVVGETLSIESEAIAPEFPVNLGLEEYANVQLLINGEQVNATDVLLGDGESETFELGHTFEESGIVTVELLGELMIANQTFEAGFERTIEILDMTTVEGASFPIPESLADDVDAYRDDVLSEAMLNELPVELPEINPFIVANENEIFVVFSGEDPKKGLAEAEGITLDQPLDIVAESTDFEFSIMIATDVSVTQAGTPTNLEPVVNNPGSYRQELIRVNAPHRSTAVRTDVPETDVSLQSTTGLLVEDPWEPGDLLRNVGKYAQNRLIDDEEVTIDDVLGVTQPRIQTHSFEPSFWTDAAGDIDGIVLAPGSRAAEFIAAFGAGGSSGINASMPVLYVVQEGYGPTEYDDISTLVQQSDDGDIVRVSARYHQMTLSWKETILDVAPPCGDGETIGDDWVYIETSLPVSACVPLLHDVLMHTGVAWTDIPQFDSDGGPLDDVLLVVGASSQNQTTAVEYSHGEYEMTGEIVSTDRFHEALPDGKILFAYDLEQQGNIDFEEIAGEVREIIENKTEQLGELLKAQLDVLEGGQVEDVLNHNVGDVAADDTVEISPDADEEVGVDSLHIAPDEALPDFEVTVAEVTEPPEDVDNPPREPRQVVEISTSATAEDISEATIQLRVDSEDITVDDELIAYRYHNGDWTELETEVVTETDTELIVEIETPGFSYFALTVNSSDDSPTDDGDDDSTNEEGAGYDDSTDENTADDDGTGSDTDGDDSTETDPDDGTTGGGDGGGGDGFGPGFGPGIVLAGLGGASILLKRRRSNNKTDSS